MVTEILAAAAAVLVCGGALLWLHRRLKRYDRQAAEYQNQLLARQVDEVQHIYMTMRGWRHDYHNHLQSLKAYLKADQLSEAMDYLDRLETDLEDVDQLIKTGNVSVDAILNAKLSLAVQNGVEVDFKAAVPKKLAVTDIDLCVLLGNLIDNAVEACAKLPEGQKKYLRLYIGIFKAQLYISVTNATAELVRKLDEAYVTNKRGSHGHGLKRINLIVEKYSGYINRKNEPGVFVTEVLLPL